MRLEDASVEAAPHPFPVVVEVKGPTGPAQFSKLSDALSALLASLRALPLTVEQLDYCSGRTPRSASATGSRRTARCGRWRSSA